MKLLSKNLKNLVSKDLMDHYHMVMEFIFQQMQEGNLDVAEELVDKLEKEFAFDPEIYTTKSSILFERGKIDLAIETLKKGYIFCNDNFDLLYNLAYIYLNIGDEKCFKKLYNEIIQNIKLTSEQSTLLNDLVDIYGENVDEIYIEKMIYLTEDMSLYSESLLMLMSDYLSIEVLNINDITRTELAEAMVKTDRILLNCDVEYLFKITSVPIIKEKKLMMVYDDISMSKLECNKLNYQYENEIMWGNISDIIIPSEVSKEVLVRTIKNIEYLTDIHIIPLIECNKFIKYSKKEVKDIFIYGNLEKNEFFITSFLYSYKRLKDNYNIHVVTYYENNKIKKSLEMIANKLGIGDRLSFTLINNENSEFLLESMDFLISTDIEMALDSFVIEFLKLGKGILIRDFLNDKTCFDSKFLWSTIDDVVNTINDMNFTDEDYNIFFKNISRAKEESKEMIKMLSEKKEKGIIEKMVFASIHSSYDTEKVNDLTILIPSFNRLDILYDDLKNNYKLGKTNKIIADDGTKEDKKLEIISKEKDVYNIQKVYKNKVNLGIAENLRELTKKVTTTYCSYMGDDDAQFIKSQDTIEKYYKDLDEDYIMLHPKNFYAISKSNTLSDYYVNYEDNIDMSCRGALKKYFLLNKFSYGMVGICKTKDYLDSLSEKYFSRMSDDVVTLSRLYSKNLDKKVKIVSDWVYIKRIEGDNTSIDLDEERCLQSFIAHIVAGYHCLINEIVCLEEFFQAMERFCENMKNKYNFEYDVYNDLISYVNKEVTITQLVNNYKNLGLMDKKICIKDLPKEFVILPDVYIRIKNGGYSK